MTEAPRLKPLADAWHHRLSPERHRLGAELTARLSGAESIDGPSQERIAHSIRTTVLSLILGQLLEECLDWLDAQAKWPTTLEPEDLRGEIADALARVPGPMLKMDSPRPTIAPKSWIAPCALGGVIGGPLLGLGWIGALLGSTGAIAGLAWLLEQPDLRLRWETSVAHGQPPTGGARPRAAAGRRGGLSPAALSQRLGARIGLQLLRWLIRPQGLRPARIGMVALRQAVEDDFDLCTHLLLLTCWSRLSARPTVSRDRAFAQLPRSIYDAIALLAQTIETRPDDRERIRELTSELTQTMSEEGLIWKTVAEGASYAPDMEGLYETFGHLEAGQPVKTLKPALCTGESVVVPGLLQRLRR